MLCKYILIEMSYSKELIDKIMAYCNADGKHLVVMKRGKLAFALKVLYSSELASSSLAEEVAIATSFLGKDAPLPARLKAVMQGID